MKSRFLAIFMLAGLLSIQVSHASPADAARIFQDKAKDYALHSANDPNFDIKKASQVLSQNAMDLGKIYASSYTPGLNDITSAQCLEEVSFLGLDSETFMHKALAGEYRTISMINGNIVMMIAAGAGMISYTVMDQGNFCKIDRSIHDTYWAANIIRMGIDGINVAFS